MTPGTGIRRADGFRPGNLVIRRIRADDWRRHRALRLEMLTDTPIAYGETLAHARGRPKEFWLSRAAEHVGSVTSAQWVVDAGDRLVGTMSCFADTSGRVHVVGVYLSPEYRGRGLLDCLFDAVRHWARERYVIAFVLRVACENDRAVRAYRRRGFVPTGRTNQHPLYPDITEMEMARPVDCG
jgi:ribosomal protein S18 acetylase RimI-like enzyme